MIQTLLHIRIKQAGRLINDLGILFGVLILPFIGYAYIMWCYNLALGKFSIESAALIPCITAFFHISRKDKKFVRMLHERPELLYFIEYLALFALPLFVLSITGYWYLSLCIIIGIGGISFIKHTYSPLKLPAFALPFISKENFEWKSGLRKGWLGILLLEAIAIGFYWNQFVPLGVLIGLALIVASFNTHAEPLSVLLRFRASPIPFLLNKFKRQFIGFLWLSLPSVAVYLISYPAYWYILTGVLLVCLITIAFGIVFKYALYEPDLNLENNQSFIFLIPFAFLISFLIPIPIFMLIRYFRKAVQRLNFYFND